MNFIGWYETDWHVYIVMEFHGFGSLDQYMSPPHPPLPEPQAKIILEQVLQALEYMHGLHYMHRDLKPAVCPSTPRSNCTNCIRLQVLAKNILVVTKGPRWWVKLADFGYSKRAIESHAVTHTVAGTPRYMAPELQGVIENGTYTRTENVSYTEAVDIWAVGVMAFEILAGHHPFCSFDEVEKYTIGRLRFPIKPLRRVAACDEACNFVRSLMTPQPTRRPNAKECLQQYWLQTRTMRSGNPTISLRGDSGRTGSTGELQEASGTWTTSEEVFQDEVEGRRSKFDETASTATLLHSIASGTAPAVSLNSPVTHAGHAAQRAPETVAQKRHLPRRALPAPQRHSQSLNDSSMSDIPYCSPTELTETTRHAQMEIEHHEPGRDEPDDPSGADVRQHNNALLHGDAGLPGKRRSLTPNSWREFFRPRKNAEGRIPNRDSSRSSTAEQLTNDTALRNPVTYNVAPKIYLSIPGTEMSDLVSASLIDSVQEIAGATEPQYPRIPPNNHSFFLSPSSIAMPRMPITPQGKIPTFRELAKIKSTEERISAFASTRQRFADLDSGLPSWISSMLAAHPEHANVGTQRYEGPGRIQT